MRSMIGSDSLGPQRGYGIMPPWRWAAGPASEPAAPNAAWFSSPLQSGNAKQHCTMYNISKLFD
jgi:hypothetical protein